MKYARMKVEISKGEERGTLKELQSGVEKV